MKKTKIFMLTLISIASSVAIADSSVWQWSNSGQYYYYRDNAGRIHYSDGSVGEPTETWTNSDGKTVYRANSAGPKDKTGQYAIQAPRIDDTNIGPAPKNPPANAVLTIADSSKPTFGPSSTGPTYVVPSSNSTSGGSNSSNNGTFEFAVKPAPGNSVTTNNSTGSNSSVWQWSNSGQYYYYRDNDGRVHYSDGSVSAPTEVWTNSDGKTVYRANSAGPKDQTGQYAIQAPRIDDSNIGPAPSNPPSDAVLVTRNPNEATFGPSTNGPIYVTPDSQMKPLRVTNNNTANNQSNNSSNSSNNSNQDLSMPGVAAGVNNDMLMQAIAKAKNQGGDFNSIVSNPFIFCSGPKPKKGNPLRIVYDMICGDSQKNGQNASNSNSALTPTNPTPKVPGISK